MVEEVIEKLYSYYVENPGELPTDEQKVLERDGINTVVKDYIAGMTDRYAKTVYEQIFGTH